MHGYSLPAGTACASCRLYACALLLINLMLPHCRKQSHQRHCTAYQACIATYIPVPWCRAGMMSESRALFAWSEASGLTGMLRTGALVLGLHGDVALELLIAQGCRPLSSSTWQVEQTAAPVSQKILAMSKLGSKSTLPPIMALQVGCWAVLHVCIPDQMHTKCACLMPDILMPDAAMLDARCCCGWLLRLHECRGIRRGA